MGIWDKNAKDIKVEIAIQIDLDLIIS